MKAFVVMAEQLGNLCSSANAADNLKCVNLLIWVIVDTRVETRGISQNYIARWKEWNSYSIVWIKSVNIKLQAVRKLN